MTSRNDEESTSRRLHVLHVCASGSGGVANVALGYLRDQVGRGWNVSVACSSHGFLGFSAREAGADTYWWQAEREPGRRLLSEARRLSRIIEQADPDVVHLHGAKAGLVGRLVLRNRVPTVFQPHAWSHPAAAGGVRTASRRWEHFATRWSAATVCVSDAERVAGLRLGVDGRTVVIPHGVDLATYRPAGQEDRAGARKSLGLADVPTVVCIGELVAQKGQRDLLDAWPRVVEQVPDARLVLVGEGPDRAALVTQSRSTTGVSLVGGRSDIGAWLAASDVVAVPSRWDGMPLVPLEAMACARSVVATSVAGIVESVPEGAGAIVVPGDELSMAEALAERLLDQPGTDDEGLAGRAHVEAHHDVRSSTHELSRVYLRLVGERRGR